MKRTLAPPFVALAMLAVLVSALSAGVANATPTPNLVTVWNRTMVDALETAKPPPPPAMRIGAIVQSSVFDALNGIEQKYTPIHVQPAAAPGASREAAVVEAAYEALVNLFPAQKATFDAQLAASLAEIGGGPNDQSVQRGLDWGKQVADEILAWRAGDGISAVLPPYAPSGLPGRWAPTPPTFGPPLFRQFANMTPWAMTTPSQFLPGTPPALTSTTYTQSFDETKAMGSATSSTRDAYQTQTAVFYGTDTPVAIWNRVADDLAGSHHLTLTANARLLAKLNVALADGVIAIWNAKNYYDTWRPITAIQQATTDGNPDTTADPSWVPLLPTPQFQEYPAGHPGVSNAGLSELALFYGEDTTFTATSTGVPGATRDYTTFAAATQDVAAARVFGGMHFRFSCDTAIEMGTEIASYVDNTVAVPVHGPNR